MDCPAVQGVVAQAQQALEAAQEEIIMRRYMELFPVLIRSLESITGHQFQNHRTASAWWEENRENFEVQEGS